jgi:hypothetical protein
MILLMLVWNDKNSQRKEDPEQDFSSDKEFHEEAFEGMKS